MGRVESGRREVRASQEGVNSGGEGGAGHRAASNASRAATAGRGAEPLMIKVPAARRCPDSVDQNARVRRVARLQWVAGIKKTGFRGTPPFLTFPQPSSTPRRGFLAPVGALKPERRPEGFLGKR